MKLAVEAIEPQRKTSRGIGNVGACADQLRWMFRHRRNVVASILDCANKTEIYGKRTMEMHFSRLLLIVVAALPLGACMTAAEQQAQARAIAANDDAACRSAGAKRGTPAYVQCRENRSNHRAVAQREAERSMQRMMWEMNQSATRSFMTPRL